MTTITYTEQGVIIDGHAENPVACHGISAISQMVANFVEERGWAEVAISDGHLEIRKVSDEHCGDALFQAMAIAFEDIASQYPDCVQIVKGQKGGDPDRSPFESRGYVAFFLCPKRERH